MVKEATKKPKKKLTIKSAIKCEDSSGRHFDSLLEQGVFEEFEDLEKEGFLTELKDHPTFSFQRINFVCPFNGTYTADISFTCLKEFSSPYLREVKGKLEEDVFWFKPGISYVLDVKAPYRGSYRDSLFCFKRRLMKSVWGISVITFIRKHKNKTKVV